MYADFVQGMILGFVITVPLGPTNLLIMSEAVKSFKNGVAVGFGAFTADITYLLLILLGLTKFLTATWLLNTLTVLGSGFLFYIAYSTYKNRNNLIKKVEIDAKGSVIKHFTKGYLSTMTNPFAIAFWLSIATLSVGVKNPTFTIIGIFLAILIWIIVMPFFVHKSKHLISQKVHFILCISSAAAFAFFALAMIGKLLLGFIN